MARSACHYARWRLRITVLSVIATRIVLILLHNLSAPDQVIEQAREYRYAIDDPQFRGEISVAGAYVVPDRLLINALMAALDRDVRVRMLLLGPHTDSKTVRLAAQADRGPLLHAGAELHEYQVIMRHSTLPVIGSANVSVGTTNVDSKGILPGAMATPPGSAKTH